MSSTSTEVAALSLRCASNGGMLGAARLNPASAAAATSTSPPKTAIRPRIQASCTRRADGGTGLRPGKGDLAVSHLGVGNFNAETSQPDIGQLCRGQQTDRGNSEILQNLRAKPYLAPLLGAGGF